MSFWRPFGFHSFSVVDNLLDRESTTLEDLFEIEDIIQELKGQNKRLINFLTKPENITKMINYIVANKNETDYKIAVRYPCLSCEVLSSDVWLISDVVYQNEEFVSEIYSFLDGDLPSNYSSYASKVAVSLLQKKPKETFEFVTNTGVLDKLINHINQPPALELLLKLINTESLEGVNDIQELLTQKELVPKMLSFFDGNTEAEPDQQEMISQALIDIVTNSPQSPLVHQLERRATVQQLFDLILNEASISASFQSGLSVLTELVRRRGAATNGADSEVVEVSIERLGQLLQLLTENTLPSVVMTTGLIPSPFGFRKLKILEFLIILFNSNSPRVDSAFSELDVFSLCLDLFFKYPWNNFLHAAVEQLIQAVLERGDNLKLELFKKGQLIERILQAHNVNEKESLLPTGRLGYMGHLISIVLSVLVTSSNNSAIYSILNENTKWQDFIKGPFEERQILMRRYDPNESTTYENPQEDHFEEPQQNEHVDYQNPFPNDFPEDFDVAEDTYFNEEFIFEEKDNFSRQYDFNVEENYILEY